MPKKYWSLPQRDDSLAWRSAYTCETVRELFATRCIEKVSNISLKTVNPCKFSQQVFW